ncbi:hypothetical protein [Ferruginibacter sp. SUN106]|uniref:hypothetical protein n=1 Tax=Ferruginibacter sp. SUN106 TaxID=2978348 RepID=UPI003D35EAEC
MFKYHQSFCVSFIIAACFFISSNLQAQQSAPSGAAKSKTDTASQKAFNDMFDSLLIQEKEFFDLVNKYPAAEFLISPPEPAVFRKKFMEFLPTGLSRMEEIVAGHKDDEDTVYNYFLNKPVLPGTYNNQYEYMTDGMLQFDAGLMAWIDSAVNEAAAIKKVTEWKAMLQKAFPEDAAKMKVETNASGDQFITITHLRNSVINKDRTGYTTMPGWTLTLRHFISNSKHDISLMIMPGK